MKDASLEVSFDSADFDIPDVALRSTMRASTTAEKQGGSMSKESICEVGNEDVILMGPCYMG